MANYAFFVGLHDQLQCPECSYRGEKSQNVARHIALVHSKLDALLADKNLVNKRRQEYQSKPNKINIGSECPVCDQQLTKQHSRVHVIWHFMEELREIVQTFADPTVSKGLNPAMFSFIFVYVKKAFFIACPVERKYAR